MNRLLKTSAGLLSTILLAAGANSVVAAQNSCPQADNSCNAQNVCDVVSSSDCNLNNVDLQSIINQCNSNTEVLKALIESGNCSSNDLKCLIDNGTCTADDVFTALEDCGTDCSDVKQLIDGCTSDCDVVDSTNADIIKSILDSVAAKSNNENCSSKSNSRCDDVKGLNDAECSSGETSKPEISKKDDCKTAEAEDKSDCEPCDSDRNLSENCEDNSCDDLNDCEDGSCSEDTIKSILKKYGFADCDINDILNGSCNGSNGRYTFTYGDMNDINSILESFGFGSLNGGTSNTESKPAQTDTDKKPDTTDSEQVNSKPVEDKNSDSVSDYEKKVAELVNEIRAENGLKPLKLNTELSAVARIKSEDMRDNRYFSHTSPNYGSPFDMMKSFGISYRTAGENIAMGQRTPEEVVNAWMNSEGHRANILNASFTEIGVGYAANGNYWTQMFIG